MKDSKFIYPSDFPSTEEALAFFCQYGREVEYSPDFGETWWNHTISESVDFDVRSFGDNYIRAPRLSHEDILGEGWKERGRPYGGWWLSGWWLQIEWDHDLLVIRKDVAGNYLRISIPPTLHEFRQLMRMLGIKQEKHE